MKVWEIDCCCEFPEWSFINFDGKIDWLWGWRDDCILSNCVKCALTWELYALFRLIEYTYFHMHSTAMNWLNILNKFICTLIFFIFKQPPCISHHHISISFHFRIFYNFVSFNMRIYLNLVTSYVADRLIFTNWVQSRYYTRISRQ
jgi:hypothetical protein